MATKKTTQADSGAGAATPPAPDGAGAAAPAAPQSVTLASPYGWYDDDGAGKWYAPGQVVNDPGEVADLMGRKAPLVGIDHDCTPTE